MRDLITLVEGDDLHDTKRLMALTAFLSGRAANTSAKKQISQKAFIDLARSLGVNVTLETLGELIAQPPLNNILEPLEPNSDVVKFKGAASGDSDAKMSVDKARDTVDKNAKRAMKSRS